MISRQLIAAARERSAAIIGAQRRWTYADLAAAASSIANALQSPCDEGVGLWCADVPTLIATLMATDSLGAKTALFSAGLSSSQVAAASSSLQLRYVLTDDLPEAAGNEIEFRRLQIEPQHTVGRTSASGEHNTQVILFTSGTSGTPKPAVHTWQSLSSGISKEVKYSHRKWLLAYDPTSFAGTQVWLQALLTGGTVCVPPLGNYSAIIRFLIDEQIEFASATPTFWRMLLRFGPPHEFAGTSLAQITLGGEAVDQHVLDELRRVFPKTRITHIYASTEMGSCFAVHDGFAGFPAEFLDDAGRPCQLRVSESGELEIRSRRSMLGYFDPTTRKTRSDSSDEWFATGDLVERRGERVYFIGRKTETINVAGAKVYPLQVEECIRGIEGVETVYVHGIASSLTGQLVCAEVSAADTVEEETLRRNILAVCRARLTRNQVPAVINFRDRLAMNPSAKLLRSEVAYGD